MRSALPGAVSERPAGARWRVCQEGAAALAPLLTRRLVRVASAAVGAELRAARRLRWARLLEIAAAMEAVSVHGCHDEGGTPQPGALVVLLGRVAVSAVLLLDAEGWAELLLLVSDDVLGCCEYNKARVDQ